MNGRHIEVIPEIPLSARGSQERTDGDAGTPSNAKLKEVLGKIGLYMSDEQISFKLHT